MNREAALAKLLASLFNTGELRLHLAEEPEGEELRAALPERGAPLQELAMEAATALARRGLLDVGFFERLEEARPRRTKEIVEVRNLWLKGADLEKNALWSEGRYRLLEPLGHGGFGFVWKALDTETQRLVALKILHEQHATSRRSRQRFFRGASVLQQLSHTGVVKVCSAIEQEGLRYFYVMEFLGGVSLEKFVKAGGHTRDELLELLFQVGDALAYVNERGLFHRDVKPANVLITSQGQAKLIDFDLVTGDDFVTLTTTAQGTPTYMPPEAHTADKETQAYDVFGLARTFEFVLRGRERLVAETGPDPTQSLEISPAARTALRAGLHPDPTRRTQTVRALCDALRGALRAPANATPSSPSPVTLVQLEGLSVGSDPPRVEPPWKPWFRSKRWALVAPTVALMSVIAGFWIWREEAPAARGDTPGPREGVGSKSQALEEFQAARATMHTLGVRETKRALGALERVLDDSGSDPTTVATAKLIQAELMLLQVLAHQIALMLDPADTEARITIDTDLPDAAALVESLPAEADAGARARVAALLALAQGEPDVHLAPEVPSAPEVQALILGAPLWRDRGAAVPTGLIPSLRAVASPTTLHQCLLALALWRSGDDADAHTVINRVLDRVSDMLAARALRTALDQQKTEKGKVLPPPEPPPGPSPRPDTPTKGARPPASPAIDALIATGCEKVRSNDSIGGIKLLLQALDRRGDWKNFELCACLGAGFSARNDHDSALAWFKRAAALSPSSRDALAGAAGAAELAGKTAVAIEYYGKLLEVEPGNQAARNYLATHVAPKPPPDDSDGMFLPVGGKSP